MIMAHVWRRREERSGKMPKIKPKPTNVLACWRACLLSTGHDKDCYTASCGRGGEIEFPQKEDNLAAEEDQHSATKMQKSLGKLLMTSCFSIRHRLFVSAEEPASATAQDKTI